jgi:Tol biopolymer transport system component
MGSRAVRRSLIARTASAALALLAALAFGPLTAGAAAGTTELISIGLHGVSTSSGADQLALSADGRFVAFRSRASSLVVGDGPVSTSDLFLRDRQSGTTERVNVGPDAVQSKGDVGFEPALSADGRFVAFGSPDVSKLVAGDTNGQADIFVRDRQSATTERVNLGPGGAQANGYSSGAELSADGRFVAFVSEASNLVAGDTNGRYDIFVRDRQSGTTERVSVGPGGAQADGTLGGGSRPVISADGRFVAFYSDASNLVAGDTNGRNDVFVHDRQSRTTERVSIGPDGAQAIGDSYDPAISADGRFVAFRSWAYNLVDGDSNGLDFDVFVRDRQRATTERVSVGPDGSEAIGDSHQPALSADGRFVAFYSNASNLVPGDTNLRTDIFVRDRQSGATERVSLGFDGAQANSSSYGPALSADGRVVAFRSEASNLVAGDINDYHDLFVRDRESDGCTIVGGPGDDTLSGTPGHDVICGLGGNDDLRGGGGNDVLYGGDGDDRLLGGSGPDGLDGGAGLDRLYGGTGPDILGGGPGTDLASYFGRTNSVGATIGDGFANDGASGERDDVRSTVEQLAGGDAGDRLSGDDGANRLSGHGGNDIITGGLGRDILWGGAGDDSFEASDGQLDRMSCGDGLDSVLRDPIDTLASDCESG